MRFTIDRLGSVGLLFAELDRGLVNNVEVTVELQYRLF